MRVFWLLIAVLTVLGVILLWRGESSNADLAGSLATSQAIAPPARTSPPADTPATPPVAAVNGATSPSLAVDDDDDDAQSLADDLLASSMRDDQSDLAGALGDRMTAQAGNDDSDAAFDPDNPVDGRYIVDGNGTADDPYEITWDLLILAAQTYQPRQGRTEIPARVQAIDGKHVRIAGYFTIPIASTDPRELLFMLNMWDGCCIGMPPSPYDAIEVRLAEPLRGQQFLNYGTLSGVLTVDPYVQNGWLLGMYVMDGGKLDVGM